MNFVKKVAIYGFVPVGIFFSYILYQTPYFSFSLPQGSWLIVALILSTLASAILFFKHYFKSKIIDVFTFLFIGISIGLYGPLALGRNLPLLSPLVSSEIYDSPLVSSEIYDLNLMKFDLPSGTLPNSNYSYQIYVESINEDLFMLATSPNVATIDFSNAIASSRYPESILSIVKLENNSLILEDKILLSELENPIYHIKDLYLNHNKAFVSSIGIDNEGCQSLQLWELSINIGNALAELENNMIFESTPKLCGTHATHQSGGRIAQIDDNTLLLTVGDFRLGPSSISEEVDYVGRPSEMLFPNSYGMIVSINLNDYSYEPYSIGHRNPQGLFVDEETGRVWASEHGPSGGGELNLIVKGND